MNNINFKELSKSYGYIKLKKDVLRNTKEDYIRTTKDNKPTSFCFNVNGCKLPNNHCICFHNYCNKFKWIIDRLKHYSHFTGINAVTILDAWEKDRSYWFMNYYQNSNQSKINNNDILILEDAADFKRQFTRGFRCPSCGGISTNPFNCNSGIKNSNNKICNWKSYGFFGTMGKGTYIFMKDKALGQTIFKPLELEK